MNFEQVSIDVFVTACGEDHHLIEQCLQAACQMRGQHKTWLLDDGDDPHLVLMAERLGAGYLTRAQRIDAKAGNINAALACTTGEIIVIFDIDHIPLPDFLEQALPFFANPRIGFVQVMLTFSNDWQSWVARAAVESSKDYYTATSIGSDSMRGTTLVGSNALIRRAALASIGGYQPGLAEDLATSIALHAAGWGSVYLRRPLAPGLAPPDLPAWFTQQLKWSRGVFELLLTAYPRRFSALALGQKIGYAVRMTYYWIGLMACLHLLGSLATLYMGGEKTLGALHDYLLHLTPLVLIVLLLRDLSFRQWRHPSQPVSSQWRAMTLIYATWPVYTLAWLMAMFRLPLAFRPTPKKPDGRLNPLWLAPQLITALLLIVGVFYGWAEVKSYPLVLLFALAQAVPQLGLVGYWLWLSYGSSLCGLKTLETTTDAKLGANQLD